MPLELYIQLRGRELLAKEGCIVFRAGTEGWPDDLIIWSPGRHFWIEWKGPDGMLTKAQKVRIPRMQRSGEPVYICDSGMMAIDALYLERAKT